MTVKRKEAKKEIKNIYPADVELTEANATFEAAKSMREVRDYFRRITYTPAGRLRVTAYTRGGVAEDIKKLLQELVYANRVKAKSQQIQKNIAGKQEVTSKNAQT